MKNLFLFTFAFISFFNVMAQNQTGLVSSVSILEISDYSTVAFAKPELFNYTMLEGGCGVITTICDLSDFDYLNRTLPFKVYCLENAEFNIQQDMYNALRAKVPGIQISNTSLNETPIITMRGNSNTIVIVDGMRFDTSILNSLNAADIESIKVVNDVAGSNYFSNRLQ
tara:strand:+ start:423 stop:929 length:507 start_codon:yes stop_codon:yes gene_type:complete